MAIQNQRSFIARGDRKSHKTSIFRSCCIVSCGGEIIGAFLRGAAAKGVGNGLPEVGDGSRRGGAQQGLELGESHFDGIEVRTVGRQVPQARASGLDRLSDAVDLMSGRWGGRPLTASLCQSGVDLMIT